MTDSFILMSKILILAVLLPKYLTKNAK